VRLPSDEEVLGWFKEIIGMLQGDQLGMGGGSFGSEGPPGPNRSGGGAGGWWRLWPYQEEGWDWEKYETDPEIVNEGGEEWVKGPMGLISLEQWRANREEVRRGQIDTARPIKPRMKPRGLKYENGKWVSWKTPDPSKGRASNAFMFLEFLRGATAVEPELLGPHTQEFNRALNELLPAPTPTPLAPSGRVENRRDDMYWWDTAWGPGPGLDEETVIGQEKRPLDLHYEQPRMTRPAPVRTFANITPDAAWIKATEERWSALENEPAVTANPRVEAGKALLRTVATMVPDLSPEMKKLVDQVTRPQKNRPLIDGTTAPPGGGGMSGLPPRAPVPPAAGGATTYPTTITQPLSGTQNISGMGAMTPGTTIRDSLLNILDRFSNAVAGGQRDPSGLATPFTVYGSALEDGQPFYFPAELFDSQTVASMTQTGPTQSLGMGGVPVMGAPPMGASLSMFPVPGFEGALQNDWHEPREYRGGWHEGTDIVAPQGTPIVAPASGTIASIHTSTNGGNVVWLVDSEGRTHKFMHLLATSSGIGTGTQVEAGQVIAFVGDTGASSTPHLHYELHVGGAAVNPHEYLLGVSSGSAVGGAATPAASTGVGAAAIPPPAPSVEGALEDIENKVRSTSPVIE
jgi:Peptidase family M23